MYDLCDSCWRTHTRESASMKWMPSRLHVSTHGSGCAHSFVEVARSSYSMRDLIAPTAFETISNAFANYTDQAFAHEASALATRHWVTYSEFFLWVKRFASGLRRLIVVYSLFCELCHFLRWKTWANGIHFFRVGPWIRIQSASCLPREPLQTPRVLCGLNEIFRFPWLQQQTPSSILMMAYDVK